MVRKKENCEHEERRKCRRRSNSPSARRARKKRSHSRCISVKRKTHSKRRYSRESSSESSLQSLAEYSSESSTSPSPKKKHGSGSKHQSAGLIKQKNYRRSTSHSPVSKKDKKSHGRKHEKKKKILGEGHLKSLKEAKKEMPFTIKIKITRKEKMEEKSFTICHSIMI